MVEPLIYKLVNVYSPGSLLAASNGRDATSNFGLPRHADVSDKIPLI
jgi:hypothetical protein